MNSYTYRKIFLAVAILALFETIAPAQPPKEENILRIDSELRYDFYTHRLGDSWSVSDSGINNSFAYTPAVTTNTWQNSSQQSLLLDLTFNPNSYFHSAFSFEFLNDYASRYWQPINFDHQLKNADKKYYWKKSEITWGTKKRYLQYFRGVGHYDWSAQGDMFNLFPQQFDTETYLRISGYPVPEGCRLSLSGKVNTFEVLYGQEIIWGYKKGIYANYNFKLLGLMNAFIYRDHIIEYGGPNERQRAFEISSKSKYFQLGAIYQPYRLNADYEYAEEVALGSGLLGSNYNKKTGKIGTSDATGVSLKIFSNNFPLLGTVNLQVARLGLVAGNKEEAVAGFSKRIVREFSAGAEVLYRRPVVGPMPLVFEGTSTNIGSAIFYPRGFESPFAVGWDNREANIVTFNFLYNRSPSKTFFRYQQSVLEDWNIISGRNSTFAVAVQGKLTKYPTSTDRLTYRNEAGATTWEPVQMTGAWATNDFLKSVKMMARYGSEYWHFIYSIDTGESAATGSFPYSPGFKAGRSSTGYLASSLAVEYGESSLKLSYGQNVWGPEDWHKTFGETISNFYQFSISKKFFDCLKTGVEYTGVRADREYLAPDFGDFDEVRAFVYYSFGPITAYFK